MSNYGNKLKYLTGWEDVPMHANALSTANAYLRTVPKDAQFVMISLYKRSSTSKYELNTSYRYSSTWAGIQKKFLNDSGSDYYRYVITDVASYDLYRGAANTKIQIDPQTLVSYDIEGNPNIMTDALAIEDQTAKTPVWAVYNLSKNTFVAAHPDEETATAQVSRLSQLNPTQTFLILKPHALVFQPVNVTIQAL